MKRIGGTTAPERALRVSNAKGQGHRITAPGTFQDIHLKLSNKYPSIAHTDYKRPSDSELPPGYRASDRAGKGRACLLEFVHGNPLPVKKDFVSPDDLELEFKDSLQRVREQQVRRLFILETLDPNFISVLGQYMEVNPRLFITQEKTAFLERYHDSGDPRALPSLAKASGSFCWKFWDIRIFEKPIGYDNRVSYSYRHISPFRIVGDSEEVSMVHQKVSYSSVKRPNGGWDALILVDPPVRDLIAKAGEHKFTILNRNHEPFQGGYIDFIPYENLQQATSSGGPERECLLDDMCYYWTTHGNLVSIGADPMIATTFLQKIVISHYMQLLKYLTGRMFHGEWQLSRQKTLSHYDLSWVEQSWSEFQSFARRFSTHIIDIDTMMTTLGVTDATAAQHTDWLSAHQDLLYLQKHFNLLQQRCYSIINSYSTLATLVASHQSLADTRRSMSEAKSVKSLTWLATCFIPLSLVCGLFSMNEKYLPGTGLFWVYFAVAVPLCLLTMITILLFVRGYNSENRWSGKTWVLSWNQKG